MTLAAMIAALFVWTSAAEAHRAQVSLSCQGVAIHFTSFPEGSNAAHVVVKSDGVVVKESDLPWSGSSFDGSMVFPVADAAVHNVSALVTWSADGGSSAYGSARLSCTPTSPPPPTVVTVTERYGCDGKLIVAGAVPPVCPTVVVPPATVVTPPAVCPACPKKKSVCPVCVSRRVVTVRVREFKARKLASATATLRGRRFVAHRRARDGRLVMRVDFRGFKGPDVLPLKIRGVTPRGRVVHQTRLYRVCKADDKLRPNFQDKVTL